MSNASPSISAAQHAALFNQLHQFESAGLPAFQAFSALAESSPDLKSYLMLMQRQLKAGQPISVAGFRAGILSDTQRTLIHAAEVSGRLAVVYRQLAAHYSALSTRINAIRSRLIPPALMLIIALIVQPLPALFSMQISAGSYFQLTLGRLAVIGAACFLLLRLPIMLHRFGVDFVLLRLPVIARRIVDRQLNSFFYILAMLLEGGLAFAEALPKAVATIRNDALREQFAPALSLLGSGASVTATLSEVPLINARMLSVLDSSEQGGKLAGGILHYTQLELDALNQQDDALATWLPRAIYGLVAIWMTYSTMISPLGTGAE